MDGTKLANKSTASRNVRVEVEADEEDAAGSRKPERGRIPLSGLCLAQDYALIALASITALPFVGRCLLFPSNNNISLLEKQISPV